jgi:hypothetical protein
MKAARTSRLPTDFPRPAPNETGAIGRPLFGSDQARDFDPCHGKFMPPGLGVTCRRKNKKPTKKRPTKQDGILKKRRTQMFKNYELLLHPTFGVLGTLAAVWVFVEALNARQDNMGRMRLAARTSTVMIWLTYFTAGYFYVLYYGADKAVIVAGPWPWAHGIFMEIKEHVFFLTLLLATLLSVVTSGLVHESEGLRKLTLWTSAGVVLTALSMEGAGAVISMGAKLGLQAKLGV